MTSHLTPIDILMMNIGLQAKYRGIKTRHIQLTLLMLVLCLLYAPTKEIRQGILVVVVD
jgi:hypothetical protein